MNNICVFGDSLAKGVLFDGSRKRYSFAKNNFITLAFENSECTVNNYAKFGYTIKRGCETIEKYSENIKNSDYTIIEFGGNDSNFDWKKISENPSSEHSPMTPINPFLACYKTIINKVKAEGSRPIMLSLPPIDSEKYFKFISNGLNAENILAWLGGSHQYIYRFHEMYNMKICELASEQKVPLIDIRSDFLMKSNYSDYLCDDGIHPNENGYKLISEAVKKGVSALGIA